MNDFTNAEVARKLQEVTAAYTLNKGNLFQIRAYENAATSIEHSTSEVKDLWEEGNLDKISGIGEAIKAHLDELFKTGKVKHWEEIKKGIPSGVFELLGIPGIGPKTALKLAKMGVSGKDDLIHQLRNNILVKKGFSKPLARKIGDALKRESARPKDGRMLLTFAFAQAERILEYLKKTPDIEKVDALGSLRRMVATIGDLDFAIASETPQKAIDYIVKMPGISKVSEKGNTKATIILSGGLSVDFIVVDPASYGALLQHFTGSKAHNIHLRSYAEKNGLSLSEFGVRNVKTSKINQTSTEEEFYGLLKMQVPPPEIREDTDEIELAIKHQLPQLVELEDIKGDLHVHSNLIAKPSHDPGVNSIKEIAKTAKKLGYRYVGSCDHQPSQANHNAEEMIQVLEKKKKAIEQQNYSGHLPRVLNLLEVDILPDGSLGVPDGALKYLDFAVASVHSSFNQSRNQMTMRILRALQNPYVKVLGHPTGRLLNKRESYKVDWKKVFKFAAKNNKALEINAYPDRLDLPDILVREAKEYGVKFVVSTDSHNVSQMDNMRFGVAVARRGWCEAKDIINTWDFKRLLEWCRI
ncbi:MAG: PHP domain protein [Candidatus Daviesbacteria bacterium GW2011_GWB1_41_5]|uniref:PHP domain protein n=1 Tax=Candidatus Daviesbacteria bacterium GW2011_GWB1_41_5 TaxID=1618429 RepID=A0A0G0WNN9_9BACT|nr:MAG: PHP domain protein [Candidatus Daviesbacteria bacterium GW2011_GWB1_41_5]